MAAASPTVDTYNLTAAVRNRQIRIALMVFGVTLGLAVALRTHGVESASRYGIFVPLLLATHWFASGLTGVCGVSALWGVRQTEDGMERIADRAEASCVRRRGSRLLLSTVAAALVLTLSLVHY